MFLFLELTEQLQTRLVLSNMATICHLQLCKPKLTTMSYNCKLAVQDERAWLNVGCA